jgi:hypothetical protein
LSGTAWATQGGALLVKTPGPRSHFTKSFECHDGTPRPVAKTQNSSLHWMSVEGSCTNTSRRYGATAAGVTEPFKFAEAADAALDETAHCEQNDTAIAATMISGGVKAVFFIIGSFFGCSVS